MKDSPLVGLLLWCWFVASGVCLPLVFAASVKYISSTPVKPTTINYNYAEYNTEHKTETSTDCRFLSFQCSGGK